VNFFETTEPLPPMVRCFRFLECIMYTINAALNWFIGIEGYFKLLKYTLLFNLIWTFRLCLFWHKIISKKYFLYFLAFGASKNNSQLKIFFSLTKTASLISVKCFQTINQFSSLSASHSSTAENILHQNKQNISFYIGLFFLL
jgi:hypothetical protein